MAPVTSTPPTRSRPLTRSQTSMSTLGKRTPLSRSSSVSSNRSMGLMTPESTPKKRARRSLENDDGRANKENIPPEFLPPPPSPTPSRLSRRSSFSSEISSISMRSRSSIRRTLTYNALPQTASSILSSFTPATPPSAPSLDIPIYLRVRGLLRATCDADHTMSMEGREAERDIIEAFLHSLDGATGSGAAEAVLYVSGSPGTGKTALVNSIIASTKVADDVKVIFINCMAITGMGALWERVAEELGVTSTKGKSGRHGSGKKVQGKDKVIEVFEKQDDIKCILVLDELDNLAANSPKELQSLFSLAATYPSLLRIMGIANTHTLTSASSLLPASEMEKLNVETIHFSPYGPTELVAILNKRFEELPQDELKKLLPSPTLTLLTKKVSSLTGDVRVLFEVLRGAIDAAVTSSSSSSDASTTSSGEGAAKVSVTPVHVLSALKTHAPSANSAKAKPGQGNTSRSGNSETVTRVCGLGLQQRLVLLALVLASKRVAAKLPVLASAVSSITPPSTPTKRSRSPMKRTSSSSSIASGASDATTPSSIDSSQLYTYYSALLAASDAFTVVSRSEFSDLLGILETTGLVSLPTPSGRSLKRASSFAGSMKSNSAGAVQTVSLQEHVREGEVVRGLGIEAEPVQKDDGDALEDGVRAIWSREMSRIKREARAKDTLDALEGVDVLEGAIVL